MNERGTSSVTVLRRLFGWLLRSRRRKIVVGGLMVLLLAMLPTAVIVISRGLAGHPDRYPLATPGALVIDPQTESHTCGYHALASIYRAYGLDPDEEALRYRLGVDVKSLVWKSDSRGTLHPDIFMVAAQDHLHVEPLDLEADDTMGQLTAHLATGHPAMVLITRRTSGAMHWVAVGAADRDRLHVIDSLETEPYWEPADDWFDSCVLSVLLIRPAGADEPLLSAKASALGAVEFSRTTERLATRNK